MKILKLLIPSVLIIFIIALWNKSKQLMRWAYGAVGILALYSGVNLVKHIKEKNKD